jgi:hypothetical protein
MVLVLVPALVLVQGQVVDLRRLQREAEHWRQRCLESERDRSAVVGLLSLLKIWAPLRELLLALVSTSKGNVE